MNYRHGFHAGNHADVLKHVALALALGRLIEKPKPIVVVDAFAAAGRYDLLLDDEAARGGEWPNGVGRLWPRGASDEPAAAAEALAPWRAALAAENPNGELRFYPGSPRIALQVLRREDKLLAVERHPEEAARLGRAIGEDRRARIYETDGWDALRSFLPPTPRRGLALIDPPFERPGEYGRIVDALADGLRRWATGVFLVWHALKDLGAARAYLADVRAATADAPTLAATLRVAPDGGRGLTASGVLVVNPPFGMAERFDRAGREIARRLAAPEIAPAAAWRLDWLTPPR